MWNVECGMWNVECKMYYLRLEKTENCRDGVPFPSKIENLQLKRDMVGANKHSPK